MVIVTGKTGNLGSIITAQLKEKKIETFPHERLEITDKKAIKKFLSGLNQKPKAVFHCAALTNIAETEKDPQKTMLVNEIGTRNLLEALIEAEMKPWFCYLSTSHVYKYKPEPATLSENDELAPRSVYAQSKLQGEKTSSALCEKHDIPLMIARVFSYYSVIQKESFVVPRLAHLVSKAKKGEKIKTGWLGAHRDFLEVTDVASALIMAMEKSAHGVFNICSGDVISIKKIFDIFSEIRRESEKDFYIEHEEGEPRADDVPWIVGSPQKLADQVGFKPRVSLENGLKGLWRSKHG